jgi:TonB family protein
LFLACFLLVGNRQLSVPRDRTIMIELADPLESLRKKRDESAREDTRKRIVQTERGTQVAEAPRDSFLGERNQEVDRETVNKERTTAMGSTARRQAAVPDNSMTQAEAERKRKLQAVPNAGPLSGLAIPILPAREKGGPRAKPDEPNWANVGNLPQDYVKGLKESEKTALNTKEYVFYGYFQRIRERLDRAWVPILRERLVKLWKTGRQLASDMDHTTQVMVILNPSGEIVRVKVMSESGTRDLDEAAVRAFNQAGPFPNPPKGIVDPNGEIQIPWQFVLKT